MSLFRVRAPRARQSVGGGREKSETPVDISLMLYLLASQLQAGLNLLTALEAMAQALPASAHSMSRALQEISALLAAGVPWGQAWEPYSGEPALRTLRQALGSVWEAGSPSASMLVHAAEQHRNYRRRHAERIAAQLSVSLVIPLGLCSLPAFIALSVVPLLLGLMPVLWS
ncbi:MAG: type II secretion system F family protein [Rothia sp. (in: high G+C Gram-positive bacteria)]|uniref:type II secretion system F family protein n=1 Tax=Rothia sp. (in: high G+C Gram-positive bacteria) TaxID=1885016 RepID=UPI0026DF1E74|nr:type II secretion system F family protein [Rothia sp. (in: high G+C Gram-positive bacteria)]MDO5749883.1 type II secretion system F family protein [Rothia sp. (in: high G+C Gram-positive bacteria)]